MFNLTLEFYETENRNVYPYLLTSSYVYYVIKTGDVTGCLMTRFYLPIFIYRYTFKFTFKFKLSGQIMGDFFSSVYYTSLFLTLI